MPDPHQQTLYRPEFEHDACGVGFIARTTGRAGHDIVQMALQAVGAMKHRSGHDADGLSGDGAGVMTQIPHRLLSAEIATLPEPGDYALGMLFTLRTHQELFASAAHHDSHEPPWPMGLALTTLAVVTVVVALVSEVFVASAQEAAAVMGMTPAFVGFIVVALVGGAAEKASAFSGARRDRLDLSVGIALGAATQIALFVAPVLVLLSYVIGPAPMDLTFWPGAVAMMLIGTLTIALVTNGGRSAWFVGVLVLMVYIVFALTLYLLPPLDRGASSASLHAPAADTRHPELTSLRHPRSGHGRAPDDDRTPWPPGSLP